MVKTWEIYIVSVWGSTFKISISNRIPTDKNKLNFCNTYSLKNFLNQLRLKIYVQKNLKKCIENKSIKLYES